MDVNLLQHDGSSAGVACCSYRPTNTLMSDKPLNQSFESTAEQYHHKIGMYKAQGTSWSLVLHLSHTSNRYVTMLSPKKLKC